MPATPETPRTTKKLGPVAKVGNLTADFELKTGKNGTVYTHGSLAVDTPKTPGDWAGPRGTAFYDLALFRSLAENAALCLKKGDRVVVAGEAEVETWTGEDGQEHTAKRILVNALGPDVRWATATIAKVPSEGGAGTARGPARSTDDDEPF